MKTQCLFCIMLMGCCVPFVCADEELCVALCDPVQKAHSGQIGCDLDERIFVAVLDTVAQQEGWTLTFQFGSVAECEQMLAAGDADMLAAMPYSETYRQKYDFTRNAVVSTWAQIYASKRESVQAVTDLEGRAIGVVKEHPDNLATRNMVRNFGLNCQFVEVQSQDDLLRALDEGWVDVIVLDRLYGALHAQEYASSATPIVFHARELRFAVPLSSHRKVRDAIDYYLEQVKGDRNSDYHAMLAQLLSAPADNRILKPLCWALGIAVVLVVATTGFIVLLRRQVKRQTAALVDKNAELECEIQVRGEIECVLHESMGLLESVFGGLSDGILVLDSSRRKVLKTNSAAAAMYRCEVEELLECSPAELIPCIDASVPPTVCAPIHPAGEEMEGHFCVARPKRLDGSEFVGEVRVVPIRHGEAGEDHWLAIVRDITRHIEAEEALRDAEGRLRQSQKMEAIGTLAGGIAHDFNNLLTPIIGFSDPDVADVREGTPAFEALEQIMEAACRARDLVAQILAFSRKGDRKPQTVHLGPIVQEAMKLLRASLPSTVSLTSDLSAHEDSVVADPTEIHQVIMNLVTNAAQAVPEQGGRIHVSLEAHSGPAAGWFPGQELTPGQYVRLSVADNGDGMEQSVLQRIFEPYFTTKGPTEGTGMGLAVVHGIVQSCSGEISVETVPRHGAVFNVYLPLTQHAVKAHDRADSAVSAHHCERVLFVDDEETITKVVRRSLPLFGYEIEVQTDPEGALQLFGERPDDFDIVITDYTMPGMNGITLARKILEIRSGMPIVLCSGYSESISTTDALTEGIHAVIRKPFSPRDMANQIGDILAGSSPAGGISTFRVGGLHTVSAD